MNSIDIIFTPSLLQHYDVKGKTVLVVDIFRATTVICTMFKNGAKSVIPVENLEIAKEFKKKGYLVSAERNGKKVDFADFNNSPFVYTKDKIVDKEIVYSTLNGTNAINMVKDASQVLIASFLNLSAIVNYLTKNSSDLLILCSGWKGKYCLEDTIFAGAISDALLKSNLYEANCDSVTTACEVWGNAKNDLRAYADKTVQRSRLQGLGIEDEVIDYCFSQDSTDLIPVFQNSLLKLM